MSLNFYLYAMHTTCVLDGANAAHNLGDYPELDITKRRPLGSRRQAGVLLCCFISIVVSGKLHASAQPRHAAYKISVASEIWVPENIVIANFAVGENCLCPSFDGSDIRISQHRNAAIRDFVFPTNRPRPHAVFCCTFFEGYRRQIAQIQWPRHQAHSAICDDLIGWSLSRVFIVQYQYWSRGCGDSLRRRVYLAISVSSNQTARIYEDVSAQLPLRSFAHGSDGFFGSDGRLFGSFSRRRGIFDPLFHQPKLNKEQSGLNRSCGKNQPSESSENDSPNLQSVLVRRFFIAMFIGLCGLGICLLGGNYLYNKRTIIGAAILLSGGLLGASGLLLCALSIYPSTWSWWL